MRRAAKKSRIVTMACRIAFTVLTGWASILYSGAARAGETVQELVENPFRPVAPDAAAWDYQSRYLLENAFKSMDDGNYDNARQLMDRVMKVQPADTQVMLIAMFISYRLEDWPEAERLLTMILEMRPGNIPALARRAYVRSRMGLHRQALADIEILQPLELSPLMREYVDKTLGEYRVRWQEAKREMDGEWNVLRPEIVSLMKEERWSELATAAEQFLGRQPESADARYVLGLAYLRLDRRAEARDQFVLASSFDPDSDLAVVIELALADVDGLLTPEWARPGAEMPESEAADLHRSFPDPVDATERTGTGGSDEWAGIIARDTELRTELDWDGLEAFYGELVDKPEYAAFAHTSRAFLRYFRGSFEEARADFAALLDLDLGTDEHAAAREMIAAIDAEMAHQSAAEKEAAAWAAVEKEEKALREKEDWQALEAFYGRLIGEGTFSGHAYEARGYLRHSQGRLDEAWEDFLAALESGRDTEDGERDLSMIARLEAERNAGIARSNLEERAAEFARAEDWAAAEQVYDRQLAENPDDAHALAMRGFARLDLGWVDEAEADFAAALALNPDSGTRARVEDAQRGFAEIRAGRNPVGSPRAEEFLGKIAEYVEAERFAEAGAYLAKLDKFRLNNDQEGRREFFAGELLWAGECFDEAYNRHRLAAALLSDGYYRSQALWRQGEYQLRQKDREGAKALIHESIAAMPDAEWRLVQAGQVFSAMGMDREAVDTFEQARTKKNLREEDADFYPTLARSYRNLGDRYLFHHYMERQIELDMEKIASEPSEDGVQALYRLRRDYANMARRVGGHQFIFADRYEHKDFMVQYQNEINLQLRITRDIRAEAYFQTIATIASRFSGSYFDTWSGIDRDYSGLSHLNDGVNVVAGLRVYPLPRLSGLSVSLDQVFAIGRDTEHDTRAHIGYYGAIGNDWNPVRSSWNYASLWADAVHSFRNNDFTLRSEGRLGRSFRMDGLGEKVVFTPYLGLVAGFSGRNADKSERAFLEGGPGLMFRKYFRESKYFAPRSSIDLVVQYRVGFTHNRSNALSLMLFHSF